MWHSKWVADWAMSLSSINYSHAFAASKVLRQAYRFQMPWIDASTDAAKVIKSLLLNRTMDQFIYEPVSHYVFTPRLSSREFQ